MSKDRITNILLLSHFCKNWNSISRVAPKKLLGMDMVLPATRLVAEIDSIVSINIVCVSRVKVKNLSKYTIPFPESPLHCLRAFYALLKNTFIHYENSVNRFC